jgi:DNA-binding transcriptional regulator YhcF (GntR family)
MTAVPSLAGPRFLAEGLRPSDSPTRSLAALVRYVEGPYPQATPECVDIPARLSYCHRTDGTDAVRFQLNFKSGKPVYLQLVDQVKAAAASGAVQAGEPLPSIRPLAEELRVNRNTVAKAYAELEHQRVIETIAGKGCFVRANASPFRKDVRLKLVAEQIDDAVVQAHHLQVARADFLRLAEERFDAFEHKRTSAVAAPKE